MEKGFQRENGHKPDQYKPMLSHQVLSHVLAHELACSRIMKQRRTTVTAFFADGLSIRCLQWIPHPQSMKDHTTLKLMAVMAERDAAIQQRDAAVNEKKSALAERDIAIFHRDAAYAERNAAWMERDAAIAALEYARENGMACPPSAHVSSSRVSGGKYIHSDATCKL